MSDFEQAVAYVLANEGGESDDPHDHGGRTRFGITAEEARRHGINIETLTLEQAKGIYRTDYWRFDQVRYQIAASKFLDVVVNVGVATGIQIIQRAVGATEDGIFGSRTAERTNIMALADVMECASMALADHYIDIVRRDQSQIKFLKGWIRRAIRRPR